MAHGNDKAPAPTSSSSGASTAEVFSAVLGVGQQILGQMNQNQMSPQLSIDMAALQQQQTPQTDKYFNQQKLSQIPGLAKYLALNNINPQLLDCKTLPTTMHEAKNEVCRIGVTGDRNIAPAMQLQEMNIYHNQYTQIDKIYRNFSASSNTEGQLFGVGCMKNAMQILGGFFQYRMNELDKLTTNLEAINNQFREASRSDLDAIEESTAVLEGGDSDLANKVKTKRPDLFDFSKRFENAACTSIMTSDKYNDIGKSNGLNEISKTLKRTLSTPSGKFSGESYSTSHANVVENINQLADKVAKQMELNFTTLSRDGKGYSDVVAGMRGLSSSHGLSGALAPDLFSDLQTSFVEKNEKMKSDLSDVASELGSLGAKAFESIRNPNSGAFESEVATIETRIKNSCLRSSTDLDTVLGKIYDPTSSSFANKNASNFLKDKLKQIMENDQTSLDKKLAELKAIETQSGSRYFLKMENSYEVQEVDANGNLTTKIVGASANRTPSSYFTDVIRNCEAQFKVNHLGNKMSGATAVQKLRTLHQEYKSLAKNHAQQARDEIRKKMIQCDNSVDANNQAVGSCTPDLFNTGAPGFCANAALSCSKNMQACTQQADKFVKEIKTERTARVNNYKALVQKNKQDIVKIFDTALSAYMRDGELLRGTFGVGFTSPKGIEREVMPEGARYLESFQSATSGSPDGRLLLEDPDKYVAMFKKNVENLKQSVKQQQDQIMGSGGGRSSGGLLAEHIKATEKNYKEVARDAAKYAQACIQKHDQFVSANEAQRNQQQAEQTKKNQEVGEKVTEFCRKYSMAQSNPGPACNGNIEDLTKTAASLGSTDAANELDRICNGYNNESSSNPTPIPKMCEKLNTMSDAAKANCAELAEKKAANECKGITTEEGIIENPCPAIEEKIQVDYAYYVVNNSEDSDSQAEYSAPSICASGHNGGRGNSKLDAIQIFGDTLLGQQSGVRAD